MRGLRLRNCLDAGVRSALGNKEKGGKVISLVVVFSVCPGIIVNDYRNNQRRVALVTGMITGIIVNDYRNNPSESCNCHRNDYRNNHKRLPE